MPESETTRAGEEGGRQPAARGNSFPRRAPRAARV